jgi:hypothetical protein
MSEILDVNANYEQLYRAMLRRFGGGRLLDCGRPSGSLTINPGPPDATHASTGASESLCKLECQAENSETVAIVIQPAPRVDFGPGGPIARPSATIRFGSSGAQQALDVDLIQGVVLNVTGSYVEVIANNDPLPLDILGVPVVPRPVTIGCSVGYGVIPRAIPLQRTVYADFIPPAGIVDFLVPPCAWTFTVGRTPDVAMSIDLLDEMATTVTTVLVPAAEPFQRTTSLSGDIRVVRVTFAPGALLARGIFGLQL